MFWLLLLFLFLRFKAASEWSRPDLDPDSILYYSDGHLNTGNQNKGFKDRVDLVDRDLKDGNVSLILKNVSINDTGTYECRVKPGGSRRKKRANIDSKPIMTIRLQVTDSGSNSENKMNDVPEDGNSSPVGRGLAAGVPVGMLLVAVFAVVGFLMYKRHKDKR